MKKKVILTIAVIFAIGIFCAGCASWERFKTDMKSDMSGGLNRTINIYTADGELMRTYTGKIDIEEKQGGYIKFDFDGKRYIYYNCFIETIAELED